MASLYDLKPRFTARLVPLADRLAAAGIGPDALTLAALALALAAGLAMALLAPEPAALWLLPAASLLRIPLNALDGLIARRHGLATKHGALLNELGDVAADAALYLPLALFPPFSPVLVVLFVVGALLAEFTGVCVRAIAGVRPYDGPMGKADRALLTGLLAVLAALGLLPARLAHTVLALALVGLALTVVRRARPVLAAER